MAILETSPRQVRILKCAILSPGLINRASDAKSKAAIAGGINILPYVLKIDLYESIFDNTISGIVTMMENVGLTEVIPIVGVETIGLVFQVDNVDGTDAMTFNRVFRVIGLKNQAFPRHDFRLYELHLATSEFVQSISKRICRAFHDVSCVDAVQNILANDLGVTDPTRVEIEPTYSTVDVVIPNYTPLMAINYFAMLAQTTTGKLESNFLFYETMLGGFHFKSISAMIQAGLDAPTLPIFNVDSGSITSAPEVLQSDVMQNVMKVHQEQGFDLLFDIASGGLRSRLVHFDFLARKFHDHEEDSRYTKTFDRTTHLDKFPVYPRNFDLSVEKDVRVFMVPSNVWTRKSPYVNNADAQPEQRMHEAIMLRNRQLKEIKHVETLLDLPGSPTLQSGSVIRVNYPSSRVIQGLDTTINVPLNSPPTPYYSGKHLVTAIHHILSTTSPNAMEYRMTVKVNRDSFGSPLISTPDSSET
jgi:hypothetical protein